MAQFNEWNELGGIEGNMMAEPRVFGHDAIAQTPYWNFTISAGGTGYTSDSVGDTVTDAATGIEAKAGGITLDPAANYRQSKVRATRASGSDGAWESISSLSTQPLYRHDEGVLANDLGR